MNVFSCNFNKMRALGYPFNRIRHKPIFIVFIAFAFICCIVMKPKEPYNNLLYRVTHTF